MKKLIRSPITWTIIVVLILGIALYFCGFRITYAPQLENSWDAVSACASWASVVVAGFAIYYAILIPKKIAQEQNKIALFEKRYEVFQLFERCFSFAKAIEKSESKDDLRKDCMILFDELKYEELNFKHVIKKVSFWEHTAICGHQRPLGRWQTATVRCVSGQPELAFSRRFCGGERPVCGPAATYSKKLKLPS